MRESECSNHNIFNLTIILVALINLGIVVAGNFVDDSRIRLLQLTIPALTGFVSLAVAGNLWAVDYWTIKSKLWLGTSFISLAILMTSISVTQTFEPMPNEIWEGFGLLVGLSVLVLSGLTFSLKIARKSQGYGFARFVYRAFVMSFCLIYLLNLIQPNNGFLNINDQTYIVLDELLAPISGWTPNSNYLPAYTSLLGYLFLPLKLFEVSSDTTMKLIVFFANIATLSVLLIIATLLKIFLPTVKRSTLWLATLALVGVTAHHNQQVSVYHNFGWFGRHFLPFFSLYVLVLGLKRPQGRLHYSLILFSAALSAITVLNNPDYGLLFGLALIGSSTLLMLLLRSYRVTWLLFLGCFVALIFSYLLVLQLSGNPWKLDYFLALVLQATEGEVYGFSAVNVFGPHIIVLAIFGSTLCLALLGLRRFRTSSVGGSGCHEAALFSCSVVSSIWSLLIMQKWSVSPHTIGVSYYFANAVLCGGLLIAMAKLPQSLEASSMNWRYLVKLFPIVAASLLPFASILQVANPIDELKRVLGQAHSFGWSSIPSRPPADSWNSSDLRERGTLHYPTQWLRAIEDLVATGEYEQSELGYFGYMGNTVQLITGVKNVTAMSAPEHFRFGQFFVDAACSTIESGNLPPRMDYIVVFGLGRDPSLTVSVCRGLILEGRDTSGLLALYRVQRSPN